MDILTSLLPLVRYMVHYGTLLLLMCDPALKIHMAFATMLGELEYDYSHQIHISH
jgi:hypothetical protein